MRWSDVRTTYPNQWLVIEALEAHTEGNQRILKSGYDAAIFSDIGATWTTCAGGRRTVWPRPSGLVYWPWVRRR